MSSVLALAAPPHLPMKLLYGASPESEIAAEGCAPLDPPIEWFTDEAADEAPPSLRYFPDGRIAGVVAPAGRCLLDGQKGCWTVPRPADGRGSTLYGDQGNPDGDYSMANCGHTMTAEGIEIPTGTVAGPGGHANPHASVGMTRSHYDNSDWQTGRGRYVWSDKAGGLVFVGAAWPELSPRQIATIRASAVSVDYRWIEDERRHRLVASCLVNVGALPSRYAARVAAGGVVPIDFADLIEEIGYARVASLGLDDRGEYAVFAAFVEEHHPRWPPGSPDGLGGKFMPADGSDLDKLPGVSGGSGTAKDPFVTDNVSSAAIMLYRDVHVQLTRPDEVGTLLDHLKAFVDDAKAKGSKAPDLDLCNVSVPGTSIFCVETKGIPRIEMPQLSGVPLPGSKADKLPKDKDGAVNLSDAFKEHLASQGIETKTTEVEASHLKASQNELNGGKIAGMFDALDSGKMDMKKWNEPIFSTADHYIVDGHHRWAANVAESYDSGKTVMQPVNEIQSDIITILKIANDFSTDMGIPQAGVGAPSGNAQAAKAASVTLESTPPSAGSATLMASPTEEHPMTATMTTTGAQCACQHDRDEPVAVTAAYVVEDIAPPTPPVEVTPPPVGLKYGDQITWKDADGVDCYGMYSDSMHMVNGDFVVVAFQAVDDVFDFDNPAVLPGTMGTATGKTYREVDGTTLPLDKMIVGPDADADDAMMASIGTRLSAGRTTGLTTKAQTFTDARIAAVAASANARVSETKAEAATRIAALESQNSAILDGLSALAQVTQSLAGRTANQELQAL